MDDVVSLIDALTYACLPPSTSPHHQERATGPDAAAAAVAGQASQPAIAAGCVG